MKIEFVSYTGKYPNLCEGILTLKVNGIEEHFGYDYNISEELRGKITLRKPFWSSGGDCGFNNGYSEAYCNKAPWDIDPDFLPDFLKPYADKISELFNENVPYGCCGGCL